MAFKFPLSPEISAKIKRENSITATHYGLDNLSLAIAILGLCRQLRALYVEAGRADSIRQDYPVYDGDLVWNVLPDLAWRLGLQNRSKYVEGERRNSRVLTLNGAEYRRYVWSVLRNSNIRSLRDYKRHTTNAAGLLDRESINGNIVEIALQRLYPAENFYTKSKPVHPGNSDPCDSFTEIAGYRGYPNKLSWTPQLSADYENRKSA